MSQTARKPDPKADWHVTRQLLGGPPDMNARSLWHGERRVMQLAGRRDGWNPADDAALQGLCNYLNGMSDVPNHR